MKLNGFAVLLIALNCLSLTPCSAQKESENKACLSIPELTAFEECCFQEEALKRDTSLYKQKIYDLSLDVFLLQAQAQDDQSAISNKSGKIVLLENALQATRDDLANKEKKTMRLINGLFVVTPIAIISTTILFTQILNHK